MDPGHHVGAASQVLGVHSLLTLRDVLMQTEAYQTALADLPTLGRLVEIDWAQFR